MINLGELLRACVAEDQYEDNSVFPRERPGVPKIKFFAEGVFKGEPVLTFIISNDKKSFLKI